MAISDILNQWIDEQATRGTGSITDQQGATIADTGELYNPPTEGQGSITDTQTGDMIAQTAPEPTQPTNTISGSLEQFKQEQPQQPIRQEMSNYDLINQNNVQPSPIQDISSRMNQARQNFNPQDFKRYKQDQQAQQVKRQQAEDVRIDQHPERTAVGDTVAGLGRGLYNLGAGFADIGYMIPNVVGHIARSTGEFIEGEEDEGVRSKVGGAIKDFGEAQIGGVKINKDLVKQWQKDAESKGLFARSQELERRYSQGESGGIRGAFAEGATSIVPMIPALVNPAVMWLSYGAPALNDFMELADSMGEGTGTALGGGFGAFILQGGVETAATILEKKFLGGAKLPKPVKQKLIKTLTQWAGGVAKGMSLTVLTEQIEESIQGEGSELLRKMIGADSKEFFQTTIENAGTVLAATILFAPVLGGAQFSQNRQSIEHRRSVIDAYNEYGIPKSIVDEMVNAETPTSWNSAQDKAQEFTRKKVEAEASKYAKQKLDNKSKKITNKTVDQSVNDGDTVTIDGKGFIASNVQEKHSIGSEDGLVTKRTATLTPKQVLKLEAGVEATTDTAPTEAPVTEPIQSQAEEVTTPPAPVEKAIEAATETVTDTVEKEEVKTVKTEPVVKVEEEPLSAKEQVKANVKAKAEHVAKEVVAPPEATQQATESTIVQEQTNKIEIDPDLGLTEGDTVNENGVDYEIVSVETVDEGGNEQTIANVIPVTEQQAKVEQKPVEEAKPLSRKEQIKTNVKVATEAKKTKAKPTVKEVKKTTVKEKVKASKAKKAKAVTEIEVKSNIELSEGDFISKNGYEYQVQSIGETKSGKKMVQVKVSNETNDEIIDDTPTQETVKTEQPKAKPKKKELSKTQVNNLIKKGEPVPTKSFEANDIEIPKGWTQEGRNHVPPMEKKVSNKVKPIKEDSTADDEISNVKASTQSLDEFSEKIRKKRKADVKEKGQGGFLSIGKGKDTKVPKPERTEGDLRAEEALKKGRVVKGNPLSHVVENLKGYVDDIKNFTKSRKNLKGFNQLEDDYRTEHDPMAKNVKNQIDEWRHNIFYDMSNKETSVVVDKLYTKDFIARAKDGKELPDGITLKDSEEHLAYLESISTDRINQAEKDLRDLITKIGDILVSRGVLETSGTDYMPHQIVDFLPSWAVGSHGIKLTKQSNFKNPYRAYAKKAVGSKKIIATDERVIWEHIGRVIIDNKTEDFMLSNARKYDKTKEWKAENKDKKRIPPVVTIDGERYRPVTYERGKGFSIDAVTETAIRNSDKGESTGEWVENNKPGEPGSPFRKYRIQTKSKTFLLPEGIAKEFSQMSHKSSDVFNILHRTKRLTGVWKGATLKTSGAVYMFNNATSDLITVSNFAPTALPYMTSAERISRSIFKPFGETVDSKLELTEFEKKIKAIVIDKDVANSGFHAELQKNIIGSKNPLSSLYGAADALWYNTNDYREAIARIAVTMDNYKRLKAGKGSYTAKMLRLDIEGLDVESAAGLIGRRTLIDYGKTSIEASLLLSGNLAPFYKWQAGNLRNYSMAVSSGKYSAIPLAQIILSKGFTYWFNRRDEDAEEMENNLYPYMRNRFHMNMTNPFNGEKFVWAPTSPSDSALAWFGLDSLESVISDYSNGNLSIKEAVIEMRREVLGGVPEETTALINPLVQFFIGLKTNKDTFSGRKIMPKALHDAWQDGDLDMINTADYWLPYLSEKLITPLSPLSRMQRSTERMPDNFGERIWSVLNKGPLNYKSALGYYPYEQRDNEEISENYKDKSKASVILERHKQKFYNVLARYGEDWKDNVDDLKENIIRDGNTIENDKDAVAYLEKWASTLSNTKRILKANLKNPDITKEDRKKIKKQINEIDKKMSRDARNRSSKEFMPKSNDIKKVEKAIKENKSAEEVKTIIMDAPAKTRSELLKLMNGSVKYNIERKKISSNITKIKIKTSLAEKEMMKLDPDWNKVLKLEADINKAEDEINRKAK